VSARAVGALVAVLALALDQASKLWLVFGLGMAEHERISVAPFADFALMRNPGISYSLFPQHTETGRWALAGLTFVAIALLCVWLWRIRGALAAVAVGAIIGGALGNGLDRVIQGSVVDFVDLHIGGYHWYVFNLADAAICIGVALLLLDSFLTSQGVKLQGSDAVGR